MVRLSPLRPFLGWPGRAGSARDTRHRSANGVALNVDMDLAPFSDIDPCGYPGLEVTQTSAHGVAADVQELDEALAHRIAQLLEAR